MAELINYYASSRDPSFDINAADHQVCGHAVLPLLHGYWDSALMDPLRCGGVFVVAMDGVALCSRQRARGYCAHVPA